MQHASEKLKPIGSIANFRGRKMPVKVFNQAMETAGVPTRAPMPPIWDTLRISLSNWVKTGWVPGCPGVQVVEELRDYRKNGFVVMGVRRETGSVERSPLIRVKPSSGHGPTGPCLTYKLTFEDGFPAGSIGSSEYAYQQKAKERFKYCFDHSDQHQIITGTTVGKMLRRVVDELGAYQMGSQNYWMPPAPSIIWADIAKELRHDLTIRCFKLDATSPETMASIRDAVMEDIEKRAEEIRQDIASGNLSKQALEVRKERAQALQQEIKQLEAHFGETLDFVRSKANVANQGLASSQSVMDDDDIFKVDL